MQDVPGFERADHGLKPAALAEWRGFLFVSLADEPVPFAEALSALQGKFEHWRVEELKSVHQTVYEVEANWKLFFHNYGECYHCPNVHPHLNKRRRIATPRTTSTRGRCSAGRCGCRTPRAA
jgi:Rieske 2Fe-2S family protein